MDTTIPLPAPNTPPAAGVESIYKMPLKYRHHAQQLNFVADELTDQADIIDTISFDLNATEVRFPMTVAQIRRSSDTFEFERYSGNRPETLILNWRAWQNARQDQQDRFSVGTGGVFEFVMKVKFKPGITGIRDNNSVLFVDDGLILQGTSLVPQPVGGIIHYERPVIQNSAAEWFDWDSFKKTNGGIKRALFEDGGKLDEVEVFVDKVRRWKLTRSAMKSLVLDMMGVSPENIDLDKFFLVPFDYLNRAGDGLDFDRLDGSRSEINFRLKTNDGGGFGVIMERFADPTRN